MYELELDLRGAPVAFFGKQKLGNRNRCHQNMVRVIQVMADALEGVTCFTAGNWRAPFHVASQECSRVQRIARHSDADHLY